MVCSRANFTFLQCVSNPCPLHLEPAAVIVFVCLFVCFVFDEVYPETLAGRQLQQTILTETFRGFSQSFRGSTLQEETIGYFHISYNSSSINHFTQFDTAI